LQLYVRQENLTPRLIVFVDDNIVNAYNVYSELSSACAASGTVVRSYWFEPPPQGRNEVTRNEIIAFLDSTRIVVS
jgi:hypothetical protein